MTKAAILAAAGLLALAAPGTAQAQGNPQTRNGFTIAFGLGNGSAKPTCDGCADADRKNGVSGFLRLGGAVSSSLIISGQTRGWTHSENGATADMGFLLAGAQWYPQPATGWYLEGGLGLGTLQISDDVTGDKLKSVGAAISVGTGYDFRVGKNFSLTPYLNIAGMAQADAKLNGAGGNGKLGGNLVQLGLAFTWH